MLKGNTKIFSVQETNNTGTKAMNDGISGGIKSFSQYLKGVSNNGKSQGLKLKLLKYQDYLNQKHNCTNSDPIQHLMRLYYIKGWSLETIYEETSKKGLDYNGYQSLHYLFSEVFGWKLRERTEYTEAQRIAAKDSPGAKKILKRNIDLSKKNLEEFSESVTKIIDGRKSIKTTFSLEKYNSFTGRKGKSKKVFYLLECFSGISFEDIMQAAENSGRGSRTIALFINTKINTIKATENIEDELEILGANISYYLRERKKKKNTN